VTGRIANWPLESACAALGDDTAAPSTCGPVSRSSRRSRDNATCRHIEVSSDRPMGSMYWCRRCTRYPCDGAPCLALLQRTALVAFFVSSIAGTFGGAVAAACRHTSITHLPRSLATCDCRRRLHRSRFPGRGVRCAWLRDNSRGRIPTRDVGNTVLPAEARRSRTCNRGETSSTLRRYARCAKKKKQKKKNRRNIVVSRSIISASCKLNPGNRNASGCTLKRPAAQPLC